MNDRLKAAGGTRGAISSGAFRYSTSEINCIIALLGPSEEWLSLQQEISQIDRGAADRFIIDRLTTVAHKFLENTSEKRVPPSRGRQTKYLNAIYRTSDRLQTLLCDPSVSGTAADIFLNISRSRGVKKNADLIADVMTTLGQITIAALAGLTIRSQDGLDQMVRDKNSFLRFRLECWLVAEFQSITATHATYSITETKSGAHPSPAILFLMASINPVLTYLRQQPISSETARADIKEMRRLWSEGVHPEAPNFHTMLGDVRDE